MNTKSRSFIAVDRVRVLSDWHSFRVLLPLFKAEWKAYFFAFIILLGSSILMVGAARLLGFFVDEVVVTKHWHKAWPYIGAYLCADLFSILLMWWGRALLSKLGTGSILQLREHLFKHIHQLPMQYYDHQPEGRTVTRLTHDVESIEKFFSDSSGRILKASLTFIIALFAMLFTSWRLGGILIITAIPAIILTIIFKRRTRQLMREMSKRNSACNADLSEFMRGMDVIRNFALNEWISARYENVLERYLSSVKFANSFFSWSRPTVDLFTYFPIIFLLFVGGHGVFAGWLSVGVFVSYMRYCENFTNPLSLLSREVNTIQQAFSAVERIAEFLEEQREDELIPCGKWPLLQLKGEIEFKHVTMSYSDEKVILDDLSFHILAGEKVGFVGKTGCGKSTIMSLIARLYPFQQGEILLDGKPISNFEHRSLRQHLGFITQDVVIFKGSLRENLALGKPFSDEQILEACKQSCFALIMQDKKINLDYQILEGGSNLSVGERQLLSFTRVLLSAPSLFILDEATANIDAKYEQYLHEALFRLGHNKTVLIIAHRTDTLKECDRIFHFEQGHLISIENVGDAS